MGEFIELWAEPANRRGSGPCGYRWGAMLATLAFAGIGWIGPAAAGPTVVDFENLSDGESVTTQYPGLTFTNATALTFGISLNELEFPPASESNVVTGNDVAFGVSGPLTVEFQHPVKSIWSFFTYEAQVTLSVFGEQGQLLGTVKSSVGSNMGLSGGNSLSPNERLDFSGPGAIAALKVESQKIHDPSQGERLAFYTLDDLTFEPLRPVAVPEPGSLLLLLAGGMAGIAGLVRRRELPAG